MANNRMIQGDQPTMPFTCYDAPNDTHNLTGATALEAHFALVGGKTLILSGAAITVSDQVANPGQVVVDFAGVDTSNMKPGKNLSVFIKGMQSGRPVQFKGIALDVDTPDVW